MTRASVRLARWGALVTIVGGSAACGDATPTGGAASASAASPSSSAPPQAPTAAASQGEPLPPAPPDLDVAALQKALSCAANAKSGPCAVLAGMASCKPWGASAPSGDGRYLGRGFEVEGKKTTELISVLRLRRAPTTEVGPGQLPARVGLGVIDKEEGAPFTEAEKAIRALERSDVPPKGNAAVEHLKAMPTWSEAFVTRTTGGHVFGISHGGLHVCEGGKRELYVVRRASTRNAPGDGVYATLWAVTW